MLNSINPNVSNFKLRSNEPQKQTNMSFKAKLSRQALDSVIKDAKYSNLRECEIPSNVATLLNRLNEIWGNTTLNMTINWNKTLATITDAYNPTRVIAEQKGTELNAYSALKKIVCNSSREHNHAPMSERIFEQECWGNRKAGIPDLYSIGNRK